MQSGRAPTTGRDAITTPDLVVLAAAAVIGIALRVWVLRLPIGALDSDEGVAGLMARHLLYNHHPTVFYWRQSYGGSLEPSLAAVFFAVLGPTVLVLKLVPLTLCVVAIALIWSFGRLVVGTRLAAYGAAAFWLSTPNYIWWSTKERGFYWVCLDLGLLTLILAWRAAHRPAGPRAGWWWPALGFVAGVNFWTTPQSVYFTVPSFLYLIYKLRGDAWRGWPAAPGFVLGAVPWIAFNVRNHFDSFKVPPQPVAYSYRYNFELFFRHGLPVMMGLNQVEHWVVPGVFPVLYVLIVVGLVAAGIWRRAPLLLAVVLVLYPFFYAVFPPSYLIGEGRYLLFLAPFFWLLTVAVLRRAMLAGVVLAAVTSLSIYGIPRMSNAATPAVVGTNGADVRVPNDDHQLLDYLRSHPGMHFLADYWIVYRVTFETREREIGSPDPISDSRYPPYDRRVRQPGDLPTHVFVVGAASEVDFAHRAAVVPDCFDRVVLGGYVAYPLKGDVAPDTARTRCNL